MRTKQFYLAIILGVTFVCGGSAFAQGKHGGGKGKGNGGGGEMRVERGNGGDKGRSREMRVENGNQNWRGGDDGRGNGNGKIRGGERESRGNRDSRVERQPQIDWDARRQQQQNEWNARRQKQVNDWNAQRQRQTDNERGRRQQDVDAWNDRRQRQIIEDNERFERQRDKHNRTKDKRNDKWNERNEQVFSDRGGSPIFSERDKPRKNRKHDRDDNKRFDRGRLWQGWDNFPRGHAYGRRGIWPGEFRGWRDPDKQERRAMRELRKRGDYREDYYYRDDRDRDRVSNNSDHREYDRDDYYDDRYSRNDNGYERQDFFRSILSNFFGGGLDNGQNAYATNYYPQRSYVNYAPAYYDYQPSYAAVPQYYSQSYYPSYNDAYYGDADYGSSFGSDLLGGGNSFSSGLFSIVGQLLSRMLGQGYLQGQNDGEYARFNDLGNDAYYNPYAADQTYSASYAASLDQQRSLLRQGYELGYQDALRDRDPFGANNFGGNFGGLDIVSSFLGNGLRYN